VDLKQLSNDHLIDAGHLLKAGRWAGAYYLAGYSVECALKACIVNRISKTAVVFEDKKFAEKCFTHHLESLIEVANLKVELELASITNPTLGQNWSIVKDWSEKARYDPKTQAMAEKLLIAISDTTNGVLPWIQKSW
jgi:HEPN domain-containing protein